MIRNYEVVTQDGANTLQFNSEELNQLDITMLSDGRIHLFLEGKSYICSIVEELDFGKTMQVEVNGKRVNIAIKDDLDLLIQSMGMKLSEKKVSNNIMAPMPGLILQIKAQVGQEVSAGTELLILEAMKMENALKSSGDGVIKAIHISAGNTVEKGQLLIEIE